MKIIKKKTNQLSKNEINKIIKIKMKFWRYSLQNHHKWFKNKIKSNDIHFFIVTNSIKIYCCLRLRSFNYKKKKINFYYLDTLCSLKSHRYLVINFLSFVLKSTRNIFTITLCSKEHLFLYEFFGFKKTKNIKILNHNIKNYYFLLNIPKNNVNRKILTKNKIELKI